MVIGLLHTLGGSVWGQSLGTAASVGMACHRCLLRIVQVVLPTKTSVLTCGLFSFGLEVYFLPDWPYARSLLFLRSWPWAGILSLFGPLQPPPTPPKLSLCPDIVISKCAFHFSGFNWLWWMKRLEFPAGPNRETFSVMSGWFLPFQYVAWVITLSARSKLGMVDGLQGGRWETGVTTHA